MPSHVLIPKNGARIYWPKDLEVRYSISSVTRWTWERQKKLPPRDVHVGGKPVAWYIETIENAERCSQSAQSAATA
jgi:hypothetical protein